MLSRCRVVVTRSELDAESLNGQLKDLGAEPVSVPLIKVVFSASDVLIDAFKSLANGSYDWAVATSVNGARMVARGASDSKTPYTIKQRFKLAVVGQQSAAVTKNAGLRVDLVPTVQNGAELVRAFPDSGTGETVAAFLGDLAGDTIVEGLSSKGYSVTRVEAYIAKAPNYGIAEIEVLGSQIVQSDAILFTSPSTVQRFVAFFGVELVPNLVVCIGPSTAAAAAKAGIDCVVAQHYSRQGLLAALCKAWARKV